jgi:hypothetical protein
VYLHRQLYKNQFLVSLHIDCFLQEKSLNWISLTHWFPAFVWSLFARVKTCFQTH